MALIAHIIINKYVIIFNHLKIEKVVLNHLKAILKSKPNIY